MRARHATALTNASAMSNLTQSRAVQLQRRKPLFVAVPSRHRVAQPAALPLRAHLALRIIFKVSIGSRFAVRLGSNSPGPVSSISSGCARVMPREPRLQCVTFGPPCGAWLIRRSAAV